MRKIARILLLSLILAACSQGPPQPRPPCASDEALGSLCGFENPEDLVYVPADGFLIASNLRLDDQGGFLSLLPLDGGTPRRLWPPASDEEGSGGVGLARMSSLGEPGCGALDSGLFAPHGMYLDRRDAIAPLLYVVNHGGREAIEIFSFGRRENATMLFWSACIELPPGTAGNDVVVAPDGEVIVSNYMPPGQRLSSNLRVALGMTTGDIIAWNLKDRWRAIPGTAASAPNGVEVSADGKWIYYSSTGGGTLTRIARDGSDAQQVTIGGKPDNLTWSAAGTLLLPTHTSTLGFLRCLRQQPCRSPWRVVEVDAESLRFATLLEHDGEVVGAVASAVEVKETIYLSAVFGDRIGVWKRPAAAP